ncbi:MAG: phenylalanine--tRNA ligase subunit beta [Bacteroidota bacterium]|nr:phenylalanine--tRNA ligase subunit beta [Bacteroidota bacterium]MDX5431690.1 phenylalanine--tRNA ligase subunit beta [Bacteroidota bacterium]MDX5470405.1 phenylalanine--tRNA ligase subunit beta [Bacteroidota bacterium]
MKISLNWLKQHIELNESAAVLAEKLTGCGLEVESVALTSSVEGGLEGLLIGEVLFCEPIPDTDHLNKTRVRVGEDLELPIVCGAANVKAGLKVVVAPPGTTIYPTGGEPFTIGKRKLKGEVSEGMICAEDEIGLGTDHSGIMILDDAAPVGMAVADYLKIEKDEVLEIGLTANRGDAASHRGVARDLSDLFVRPLNPVKSAFIPFSGATHWTIELEDEACPRYSGLLMENIEVKPSPEWLQNRLRSLGLNPINNIVDITNYVLHDLGQPIHAFDADQIQGDKIIVRKGLGGKTFVTLDDVSRTLDADDLMICDAQGPMAIAGVFGGKNSGVSDKTTRIFIESAYFSPSSIRKTAKRHGLNTDASFRYERGTDPNITLIALGRVASLVEELAGGKAASPVIDVYPSPISNTKIMLERAYLDRLLGIHIPDVEVKRILKGLEIEIISETSEGWELSVAPVKGEVTRPADVVEELIRIYGLDHITIPEKVMTSFPHRKDPDARELKSKLAAILVNRGFYELSTNSMVSGKHYSEEVLQRAVYVKNPLSSDMEIMRPGMLPSLLQAVAYNRNRKNSDLKFFELGKVYFKGSEGNYFEEERLALVATGNWTGESWHSPARAADLHLLKQEVEVLLERMGMSCRASKWSFDGITSPEASKAWIHIAPVAPGLLKKWDIQAPVFYAELNWSQLVKSISGGNRMHTKAAPKFPAVRRDLSLVINKATSMAELNQVIQSTDKGLIRQVNVFDVYEGDKIEAGKKAYSLSFLLQDEEKTLSDKEIDALMNKLIANFEKQVSAIIRK